MNKMRLAFADQLEDLFLIFCHDLGIICQLLTNNWSACIFFMLLPWRLFYLVVFKHFGTDFTGIFRMCL